MFYLGHYFIVFALINPLNSYYAEPKVVVDFTSTYFEENGDPVKLLNSDKYWIISEDNANDGDEVEVKLYYETLCPDCIRFDKEQFSPAVLQLSEYVNFRTYPYGNAKTIKENGEITFECQHGQRECYGNMLHACTIEYVQNTTVAYSFNSCMMGGQDRGSNDAAADRCAELFGLDSKPIKACAKDDRGKKLLEYYGEESKIANFSYVPYILINGRVNDGDHFLEDICAAFAVSPPPCVKFAKI